MTVRHRLALLCALMAGTASGSAATSPSEAPPEKPKQEREQPPASVWSIDEDGDATHHQSGLTCPQYRDERAFYRSRMSLYDNFGLDVSCNYVDRARNLITIYLTRRSDSVEDALAEARSQYRAAHPDGSELPEAQQTALKAVIPLHAVVFAQDGGEHHSGIWVGGIEGWTLLLRATYAPQDRDAVFKTLTNMVGDAVASAGELQGMCNATPVPERAARRLKVGKDEGGALIMLLATPALLVGESTAPSNPDGDRACVEGPVESLDSPVLAWHGITANGEPLDTDLAQYMTIDWTAPLFSRKLEAGSEIIKGAKGDVWYTTWHDGKTIWVIAAFDGRPDTATLGQLLLDAIDGKGEMIGGYSVEDGNKINIHLPPD